MTAGRVLLISQVRPSRAWRLVKRIRRDVADVEICGVVQRPMQKLSLDQRMIAAGSVDASLFTDSAWNPRRWFYWTIEWLMHSVLWFIHGCPRKVRQTVFTAEDLKTNCRKAGCPLLFAESLKTPPVLGFISEQQPDLVILVGDEVPSPELLRTARRDWIRARQSAVQDPATNAASHVAIRIESLVSGTDRPFIITQMLLPSEPYDSPVGRTLKADLITDDLIVQSTAEVLKRNRHGAAEALSQWKESLFSCYAEQLKLAKLQSTQTFPAPARYRSRWKLFLDTLILCSPYVVARNWYRRVAGRYPVTILTSHLISDRAHRMAVSTETFFRQICFLRKHYTIVSLQEAVELAKSGRPATPIVVLTFDDGYADNLVSLRAVAEETGIPIALFIASEVVQKREEFQHDLDFGIRGFLALTWKQIRYWARDNIEVGAHTRSHFNCGTHDLEKLADEIVGSKLDLERHLERPIEFFAFPFGQPENISPQAFQLAKACYRHIFSGFGGENHPRQQIERQHLLRKSFYANAWELELDLQSIFTLVDRVKQKLGKRATTSLTPHSIISGFELTGRISETQLDAS